MGWCDSVGALQPDSLPPAALRLARFNLIHRYSVFGLLERMEESQVRLEFWLPVLQAAVRFFYLKRCSQVCELLDQPCP